MREEVKRRFLCKDCGENTHFIKEYYMVSNKVWLSSGMGRYDGMLCIGCLETRIGRTLFKEDFIEVPINKDWGRMSARLISRVLSESEMKKVKDCRIRH